MANETEQTVTISSDYFVELYVGLADKCDKYRMECERISKERDELKAKLDDAKAHYCTNATSELGNACKVAALCREREEKLAAAERCIEDIQLKIVEPVKKDDIAKMNILRQESYNIIRAWREKREAK